MSEQGNRSWKARSKLEASEACGCYFCLKIYNPNEIDEWIDDEQTAICPYCGIDSVLPYDEELDINLTNFIDKLRLWEKESFGLSRNKDNN